MLGLCSTGLGFLEADERPPEATPERIANRMGDRVDAAAGLLAPVGMGSHPDHLSTRDAAFLLWASEPSLRLELYADIPYALRAGWPAWVSGGEPDSNLDPNVPWERALRRLPVRRDRLLTHVRRLDRRERAHKAQVLACYASQIPALAGGPHRTFADEALSFEVTWSVTPAMPGDARPGAR
jgi:hypothetical protein